jgi:hypothetical protein
MARPDARAGRHGHTNEADGGWVVSWGAAVQDALGLLAALLIGTSDCLGARASSKTTALQTTTDAFLGGAVT